LAVPTVALFGPTSPELTGPYGPDHRVFTGQCASRPCFRRVCPQGVQECAESIQSKRVADALLEMMSREVNPAPPGKEMAP